MRTNKHWLRLVRERGIVVAGQGQPDPIDLIESDHRLQLELCDILELIADCLPSTVEGSVLETAGSTLRDGFRAHMQFEDTVLFPLLKQRGAEHPMLCSALDQLAHEHVTDEDFSQEVADALDGLQQGGRPTNPDMIGYMLRGFFLCQRRHVEWENAVVLPEARSLLTEEDLDDLCEEILSAPNWRNVHHALADVRSLSLGAGH